MINIKTIEERKNKKMYNPRGVKVYDKTFKYPKTFTYPPTKLKNITCVFCRRPFYIRDLNRPEGSYVPLLLSCGHASCDYCGKIHAIDPCPLCKNSLDLSNSNVSPLPINIYVVGLVSICHDRHVYGDEPDISFRSRASEAKLKQESIDHGHCYECGIQAVLQCLQCDTLFCHACFNKVHQFTKRRHFEVLLPSTIKDSIFQIKTCPEHNVLLDYYCNVCCLSACHHCMLLYHKQHDSVPQATKNEEFMGDLRTTLDKIAETLQRVHHTQKKLQKLLLHPEKLQNSETIETAINQHFAHLHGLLQNYEKRMIDKIQEQRNNATNNLKVIQQHLKNLDDQLQSTLTMSTDEIIGRINLRDVIPELKRMADAPCHLVEDSIMDEEKIIFYPDASIIEILENYKLEIPRGPGYKLLKTENLPEDYELEPLDAEKSSRFLNISLMSSASRMKRTWSCQSLSSRRSESQALRGGSVCSVEICHVEHPSNFYVRQVSCLPLIEDMEKKIANYVNTAMAPCEVQQGKMYVVKNELKDKWYRGRVTAINENNDDENTYEVFDVDYGSVERQVPKSRMRYISEMLMKMTQTVINCAIFDVVPKDGKWTPEANKIMTEYPKPDKYVRMHIVNIRVMTYFVDLCKEPTRTDGRPPSVRDSLIFSGHGTFNSQHKVLRMSPQAAQRFFVEKLELERYYNVYVSYVRAPDEIYLQNEDHLLYLADMMTKMAAYYNDKAKSNDGLIHVPEIDIPCAVEKTENNWFRGIINGIPGSRMVEVLLVDFGQIIAVKYEKIRRLHESYMPCPAQAIKISLTDIKPCNEQWNQEAIDFIKERLTDHFFRAFPFEKNGDSYNVALYTSDNVNIAAELVKKGLAISTGPRSSGIAEVTNKQPITKNIKPKIYNTRTPRSRKNKQAQISDQNSKISTNEMKIDPFKLQVKIIRVLSPDTIYVADPNKEETYKEMMKKMQKFYNKYEAKINDCELKELIGCQCAIYSECDKAFYRGKIIAFKIPDELDVFLYDLALTETVKVGDVQILERTFWEIPTWAFRIKLAGIYPCGGSSTWATSSCDEVKNLIMNNQNCKFFISKVDNFEKDDFSFDLWVEQAKIDGPLAPARIEINSINRMLVDLGLALPIKNYNNQKTRVLAIELKRHISHTTKAEKNTSLSTDGEFKEKCKNNGDTTRIIHSDEEILSEDEDILSYDEDGLSNEKEVRHIEEGASLPEIRKTNGYSVLTANSTVLSTEPKLTSWLPPEFIADDTFTATPTYVDNDCCLYLHSTRASANTLHFIEKTLWVEYSKLEAEPNDLVWEKGDLCIAQYHANKKWYRGQVLQVLKNDMIEVEFIDYGSIEECDNGTLRKRLMLAHIPRISTKCVIYGLHPNTRDGKWKTHDLDRIHGLLVERECQIIVLKRKPDHLVISLIMTNPTRCELVKYLINELMMDVRGALADSEFSMDEIESTMNESDDVVIEEYVTVKKVDENNEKEKINEIDDEKIAKLGESRERNEKESEKNECCDDDGETVREDEYKEFAPPTISELKNSLSPENSAKTLLADDEEIDEADLTDNLNYTTASDFITGTANFTHSPDDIEKSHQQAFNQLECISLPDTICLKDDLVTSTPFNDSFYEKARRFEDLIIPHDVRVVKAEIGSIHVPGLHMHILDNEKSQILTEYRDKFEMIMEDMQKCADNQPIPKTLEKDTPCCVKCTDGKWYRCNVMSHQNDDNDVTSMIKINFVDFGNVDSAQINEIRTMKDEWLEAPKMSLWCPLLTLRLHPANHSTDPRVAQKICDVYEKDANGEYQQSRVFYIKVESTYDALQTYEIYNDENCTELALQPLIDEGLFIKCENLNDSKEF